MNEEIEGRRLNNVLCTHTHNIAMPVSCDGRDAGKPLDTKHFLLLKSTKNGLTLMAFLFISKRIEN